MTHKIFITLIVLLSAASLTQAQSEEIDEHGSSLSDTTESFESDFSSFSRDTVNIYQSTLSSGSRVQTQFNEYASIKFDDGSEVYVSPQSDLTIYTDRYSEREMHVRISLSFGGVIIKIPSSLKKHFEVEAGNSVAVLERGSAGVQSSGFFWVESGEADVMILRTGQTSTLRNGMFAQIDENASDIVTGRLSGGQIDQLNEMVRLRSDVPLNRSFTSYVVQDDPDDQ